jgi:hypothetical protein
MTGVELDPVTAAISRALYPHAEVRTESFADTRICPKGRSMRRSGTCRSRT